MGISTPRTTGAELGGRQRQGGTPPGGSVAIALYISDDDNIRSDLAEPFAILLGDELTSEAEEALAQAAKNPPTNRTTGPISTSEPHTQDVQGSKKALLVELLKAYSNFGDQAERIRALLKHLPRSRPSDRPKRQAKQNHNRLSPDQEAELVALYRAGEKAHRLARGFRIHRTTVVAILERAGASRRPRSLTPDQVQQAIVLYGQGWSLVRIGDELGYNHGTIWRALKKAGVALRDTHGRDRAE